MAVTPQDQVAAATEDRSTTATATSEKCLLALTSLGALMVTLDALVVASAFATIRRELHASIDQLQWTANAYTLSVAMMLMVASVLGDRWGRRRMFVTGLLVFTVASAVCGVVPTIGALIAARTVQGAGAAFIMAMAMGLLVAGFPPERRGWATGIFAGITGLGVFAGPIVGGAVTQGFAWRGIFWINVPIGLVVVALTVLTVAESRGIRRPVDVLGTLLITFAVVGIVWGVVRGGTVGWTSTEVVTTLSVGGLLLVAFIGWEAKAEHPMLPLRLFANPSFWALDRLGRRAAVRCDRPERRSRGDVLDEPRSHPARVRGDGAPDDLRRLGRLPRATSCAGCGHGGGATAGSRDGRRDLLDDAADRGCCRGRRSDGSLHQRRGRRRLPPQHATRAGGQCRPFASSRDRGDLHPVPP